MRVDLEVKNYRCFVDEEPARFALGTGFTALIGANNAGKSTLLRLPYELRDLFGRLSSTNQDWPSGLVGAGSFTQLGVQDQSEIFTNANARSISLKFALTVEEGDPAAFRSETNVDVPSELEIVLNRGSQTFAMLLAGVPSDDPGEFSFHGTVLARQGDPLLELGPWMELFRQLSSTLYIGPFRNALNAGAAQHYDLQVGQGFIQRWDQWRSGFVKDDNRAALDITNEIRRIFGFNQLDISASTDGSTLQLVVDGQPYRLDEVGGGLTHFIVALVSAAIARPAFILIDEPELNLHPALQLDFLTTLGGYASTGTVFATHSIGLARAAAEKAYSVTRSSDGSYRVAELGAPGQLSELAGELGLSGYRALGHDEVLLVEGPHDVTTMQRFLRLYGAEHKVVLIPVHGGTLIRPGVDDQLAELSRLSESVYALIDSERTSADAPLSPDRQAFQAACIAVGIECHVLERCSVENYLTDDAIKSVKGATYHALQPFERLADAQPTWGKAENWRIAGKMKQSDLNGTDLGAFLARVAADA